MTDSPTPTPVGRPDLDAIRARSEAMTGGPWYIVHAQADIAELLDYALAARRSAAAWESNYNALNGEIMAGIEAKLAGAERRAAEAEEKATRELEHCQMMADERDEAMARDEQRDATIAAAARENERLREELDAMRAGLEAAENRQVMIQGGGWWQCQQCWANADTRPDLRHKPECSFAALAAETREPETSHLIPIPGKPGGFTNRNYRRPSAEPREPVEEDR